MQLERAQLLEVRARLVLDAMGAGSPIVAQDGGSGLVPRLRLDNPKPVAALTVLQCRYVEQCLGQLLVSTIFVPLRWGPFKPL